MSEQSTSRNHLKTLFSRSAQRLVLLDWLLLRAQFEGNEQRVQQLNHLHEQERLQCLGHLDFLQDNAPLLEKPLKGGDKDLESFLYHIQTDLTGLFPDIRSHLIKDNQRDVEDWLNTVERQNQELIRWIEEQLHPQHYSELEETPLNKELVQHHFTERAEQYDRSSHWCTDTVLKERVTLNIGIIF